MKTSESIDKLAEALAAAQGAFEDVGMSGKNPHFKSKYAKLSDIKKATKAALALHGLAVVQSPSVHEGRAVLVTRLMHKSGQWLEDELSMKPERGDTPQALGSAITYARRYAKASLLDVEGEEDDDGEAAEGRGKGKGEANISSQPKQEAPKPQQRPQIFDIKNPSHINWLSKKITELHIAQEFHEAIANKLNNKPFESLKGIIEKTAKAVV